MFEAFFSLSAQDAIDRIFGALLELDEVSRGPIADRSELYPGEFALVDGGVLRQVRIEREADFYAQPAHIELPEGFIHPALAGVIAAMLETTVSELLREAREHGATAVAARLRTSPSGAVGTHLPPGMNPAALIITRFPVPPLSSRPLQRTSDHHVVPGHVNELYSKLVDQVARHEQLLRAGNPRSVLAASNERCQRLCELLCSAFGPLEPARSSAVDCAIRTDALGPPEQSLDWSDEPPTSERPVGVLADDRGGWLLQFPHAIVRVGSRGEVFCSHPVPYGLQMLVARNGRVLLFAESRFYVLDLDAHSWLRVSPDDLPCAAVFSDGVLRNLRDDSAAIMSGDWVLQELSADLQEFVKPCAASPDNRYIWMFEPLGGGTFFDLTTAQRAWNVTRTLPDASAPVLDATGLTRLPDTPDSDTLEELFETDYCGESEGYNEPQSYVPGYTCALVSRGPSLGRFRFVEAGVVREDGRALLRLAMPVSAAGFSLDADQLAVASTGMLRVIDLSAAPTEVARFDLTELAARMPSRDTLDAAVIGPLPAMLSAVGGSHTGGDSSSASGRNESQGSPDL